MPWLLYTLIYSTHYSVDTEGLFCSIIMLFSMLIIIIIVIAAFGWKMHKPLGIVMFVMYIIFLMFCLLLTYSYIPCIKI